MTQDNYNYRTDPLFLRNQFENAGKYGIPIVPKASFTEEDFYDLRLIGFDRIKSDDGKHQNRMVHFFLYDYKFERVWEKPDTDLDNLKNYRAVLTPDFSMYTEMPEAMLLYNVFRNRWCGAYYASQGLRVIPTINFGFPNSYDFCFEGIEKGSTVALSTYMVQEKEGREAQKDFFMDGYNEMLRSIEPETIICYHEPFPEMAGNIIYINYELSSWQHMGDDETTEEAKSITDAHSSMSGYRVTKYGYVVGGSDGKVASATTGTRIVKHTGYVVQLGAGSAYGGQWKPKKPEDERYLGKPGDVNKTSDGKIETKIGSDGRATNERHHTVHSNPNLHSNPHDHVIEWAPDGSPRPGSQINYWDGDVPMLKSMKGISYMDSIIQTNSVEDNAFVSIADFQDCMRRGGEVQFTYNGKNYGVFPLQKRTPDSDYQMYIWQSGNDDSEAWYDDSDALLDYVIEGKKLREIIKEVEVFERTV